jgi:hypothetical protein
MAGNLQGITTLSALSLDGRGFVAGAGITANTPVLSLNTYSFSITTAAAATSIPNNSLGLVFRASGISLVYRSGGTIYSFGSSGVGSSFESGTA